MANLHIRLVVGSQREDCTAVNFAPRFHIEVAASVPTLDGMIGALVPAQPLHH